MNEELPSEKLTSKRSARSIAVGVAALLLIGGAAFSTPTVIHALTPASHVVAADPVPSAPPCDGTPMGQGVCVSDTQQQAATAQEAQLEADNAAKAKAATDAAAAAAAQQAAEQAAKDAAAKKTSAQQTTATVSTSHPKGTPLPMHLETDPNNGNYGQQVPSVDPGSWCDDHSASTINGVPTCD